MTAVLVTSLILSRLALIYFFTVEKDVQPHLSFPPSFLTHTHSLTDSLPSPSFLSRFSLLLLLPSTPSCLSPSSLAPSRLPKSFTHSLAPSLFPFLLWPPSFRLFLPSLPSFLPLLSLFSQPSLNRPWWLRKKDVHLEIDRSGVQSSAGS